jgi:hypothetical protein
MPTSADPPAGHQGDDREALLTEAEHEVVRLVGEAWTLLKERVVAHGDNYDADLAEFTTAVHHIQHAVRGQAAARAYPGRYRLLGAAVGESVPAAGAVEPPADPCADLPDAPVPRPPPEAPQPLGRPVADDRARFRALLALPGRSGWRLHTGGKVPTNLYAHDGDDPAGVPVGSMDTVWLAALVRDAVNEYLIAVDRRREREEVAEDA